MLLDALRICAVLLPFVWFALYAYACESNFRHTDKGWKYPFYCMKEDLLLHCPWSKDVSAKARADYVRNEMKSMPENGIIGGYIKKQKHSWVVQVVREQNLYEKVGEAYFMPRWRFWLKQISFFLFGPVVAAAMVVILLAAIIVGPIIDGVNRWRYRRREAKVSDDGPVDCSTFEGRVRVMREIEWARSRPVSFETMADFEALSVLTCTDPLQPHELEDISGNRPVRIESVPLEFKRMLHISQCEMCRLVLHSDTWHLFEGIPYANLKDHQGRATPSDVEICEMVKERVCGDAVVATWDIIKCAIDYLVGENV